MRVEGSPLLHPVCRATVTRVSERTPTSGTEWVRRMSGGSVVSGYEYVLEDATGNRLATSKYSWLGILKQIEVESLSYRCRRRGLLQLEVRNSQSDEQAMLVDCDRSEGVIALPEKRLSFFITPWPLGPLIDVWDHQGRHIVSASFEDPSRRVWPPLPLGIAVLDEASAECDELVIVTCAAFHVLAKTI